MSPKLPVVSGMRCVEALRKAGFEVNRQRGSHMILARSNPPATISVPNHEELDRGLLRAIIRQAGLTVDDFLDLL